jgi:VanZ family protein
MPPPPELGEGLVASMDFRKYRYKVAAVLWMALIFALSAWPGASSEGTYTFFGDWNAIARTGAHVGVFGILAGLCKLALAPASGPYSSWRWGLAFLTTALYGASDEFHQSFVPGRFGRWQDVVSDAAGAAIVLGVLWFHAARSRPSRPAHDRPTVSKR